MTRIQLPPSAAAHPIPVDLGDVLARRLFGVLRGLPESERLQVIAELRRADRRGLRPVQARAMEALAAFAADRGCPPSAATYDAWVREPGNVGHPSVKALRGACGSWAAALRLLGPAGMGCSLPAADPGARRLSSAGGRVGKADLLVAVRAWAASSSEPLNGYKAYREWVRHARRLPVAEQPGVRLPTSLAVFHRECGSFDACADEAGVALDRVWGRRRALGLRCVNDPEREVAMEMLREAAAELGTRLTRARFEAWLMARDQRVVMGYVRYGFPSWTEAVIAAGVVDPAVARARSVAFRPYGTEDLRGELLRMIEAHGGRAPSYNEVRAYARARRAAWDGQGSPPRTPQPTSLRNWFGSPRAAFAWAVDPGRPPMPTRPRPDADRESGGRAARRPGPSPRRPGSSPSSIAASASAAVSAPTTTPTEAGAGTGAGAATGAAAVAADAAARLATYDADESAPVGVLSAAGRVAA